ncbi:AraC family transcriptional regulator [Vibrio sp. SCSIO 43137]|uniref:AraC family transcriptional regulator n=1 Tax=Vibrio sp. SCSIO 43137 TaxID=3021011 RepID=UPI00230810C9|nr:helix-turn-helix domain-containing protein [Vibrio sp. SCSIO 43137]WCE32325.1 AraC family transcriptional regulator [Vibrio sp. SCSIO 43137]
MPDAHWHQEYELIFVVEGVLVLEIDSQLVEVKRGELVMINPNQFHLVKSKPCATATYYSIVWQPAFLESQQLDIIEQEYFAPLTSGRKMFQNQPFLVDQVGALSGLGFDSKTLVELIATQPPGWQFNLKIYLLIIWYGLSASDCLTDRVNPDSNRQLISVNMAKQYVTENYSGVLSLSIIADYVNLNPDYFGRLFKKVIGISLVEFITNTRIDKAEYLLKTSNKAISDICFDVGFKNLSYFSKKFKDLKGISPTQVRAAAY